MRTVQHAVPHADHAALLQAEFEDICEEAQLWTKLQHLEQLCQEQGLNDGHDHPGRYVNDCIVKASQKAAKIDCTQPARHIMGLATSKCVVYPQMIHIQASRLCAD